MMMLTTSMLKRTDCFLFASFVLPAFVMNYCQIACLQHGSTMVWKWAWAWVKVWVPDSENSEPLDPPLPLDSQPCPLETLDAVAEGEPLEPQGDNQPHWDDGDDADAQGAQDKKRSSIFFEEAQIQKQGVQNTWHVFQSSKRQKVGAASPKGPKHSSQSESEQWGTWRAGGQKAGEGKLPRAFRRPQQWHNDDDNDDQWGPEWQRNEW